MLAHGDSWFDYPLAGNSISLPHTDIIVQLGAMGNVNPYILNMSQWGDATKDEMSLPKQQLMISALQDPANWMGSGLQQRCECWRFVPDGLSNVLRSRRPSSRVIAAEVRVSSDPLVCSDQSLRQCFWVALTQALRN
jgi:hypothetical protein